MNSTHFNPYLFGIFDGEWFAYPFGSVNEPCLYYAQNTDTFYKRIAEKSLSYLKDSDELQIKRYQEFEQVLNYGGASRNKYTMKMLYFCCLLDKIYIDFHQLAPDYEKYREESLPRRYSYLINKLTKEFSNYFGYSNFDANNLIKLNHRLVLWNKFYTVNKYGKLPIEAGMSQDCINEAMDFFCKVFIHKKV